MAGICGVCGETINKHDMGPLDEQWLHDWEVDPTLPRIDPDFDPEPHDAIPTSRYKPPKPDERPVLHSRPADEMVAAHEQRTALEQPKPVNDD